MKNLKRLRELSGLSLRELSRRSGIDHGTLSRAERGETRLSPYHTFLLRKVLTIEIAMLDQKIHELLGSQAAVGMS